SYILMERALCDFFEVINSKVLTQDEKLVRTYFHQFVEGLEYLHSQGIAHLDLKPDNLLFGEDHKLKIADFDLSYICGDDSIRGKGTINFRAPEIKDYECKKPFAADIYSAGIILFALMFGYLPYDEH